MNDDRQLELMLYTVRTSRRARRVTLHLAPGAGLEVVVPQRYDQRLLNAVIEENRQWIDRNTRTLRRRSQGTLATQRLELPRTIHLPACRERWSVDYRHSLATTARLRESDQRRIQIRSDLRVPRTAFQMIRRWCRRQATAFLSQRIRELSAQCDLPFHSINVRAQKRVWGTCSADGRVYLNYKLVFLPPELVDYVIVHELCHTRHHDHSRQFWELVGKLVADVDRCEADLKIAWRAIPPWVERI